MSTGIEGGILNRFSLKARIALVTGGAGPLFGSSLSEALAEAGATVVTASRTIKSNHEFAERMRASGHDVHRMQVDVASADSIQKLRDELLGRFGRLDILVNNAVAKDDMGGGFEQQTPEHWAASAAADMVGLFAICKAFVPGMVAQKRGSIVNIASMYGVVSNDPAIYAGTEMRQPPSYNFVKGGMINFTRHLAAYYGRHGVRANCISPGGYFNHQPEAFVNNYNGRVPIGRMMDNEDIKGSVVFLASDASLYVTGANLMVDGGWTCV